MSAVLNTIRCHEHNGSNWTDKKVSRLLYSPTEEEPVVIFINGSFGRSVVLFTTSPSQTSELVFIRQLCRKPICFHVIN